MLTQPTTPDKPRPKLVPAPVIAEMMSLPLPTFYEHARKGRIPGVVKVGRRVLFDIAKVEAWIDSGGGSGG